MLVKDAENEIHKSGTVRFMTYHTRHWRNSICNAKSNYFVIQALKLHYMHTKEAKTIGILLVILFSFNIKPLYLKI